MFLHALLVDFWKTQLLLRLLSTERFTTHWSDGFSAVDVIVRSDLCSHQCNCSNTKNRENRIWKWK